MYIISKTIKGQEYLYSKDYSILCNNKKEAEMLAEHLNKNNNDTIGDFKLKDNEIWYVYQVDRYDTPPRYKASIRKNSIAIKNYYGDDFY